MTGDKTLTYPLTDEEKALVERYHNIIWKVINDMRLPYSVRDDVYDIAALALMKAVREYQTRDELRERASFASVAYNRIRSTLGTEFSARSNHSALSLDVEDDDGKPMHHYIPAPEYIPENSPETIRAYSMVTQLLTPRQLTCAIAASNHITEAEYSEMYNCKISYMNGTLSSIRKKCFARYCEIFNTNTPEDKPVRQRPVTENEHAEILRMFNEGVSITQIGRTLERSISVIHRHIKKSVRRQPERVTQKISYT